MLWKGITMADAGELWSALPAGLAALAFGYLAGSIPFGLVITRLAGLEDIRTIGSGNIGATNVLRTGHKALAAATMLLDAGKGAAAVLLAGAHGAEPAAIATLFAVLGHMFPVWLGFKGGKGVATAGGAVLALAPPAGLAAGATWLAVVFLTRYSSLAAIIATLLAPVYVWLFTSDGLATATVALVALLVLARHHENFRRLVRGQESRITLGGRRDAPTTGG